MERGFANTQGGASSGASPSFSSSVHFVVQLEGCAAGVRGGHLWRAVYVAAALNVLSCPGRKGMAVAGVARVARHPATA